MLSCTRSRFAQTQVCPVLRYLEAMAPSIAASKSASSKTMKGALPPSSSESFLTVPAHWAIRILPTSVEPVKESFRTVGFDVSSAPISVGEPVITLKTPFGRPARSASSARARAEKGVCSAGFARDHRERKIPRSDAGDYADGLLHDDDSLVGLMRRNRVAINALGFLTEPFEKCSGVGDFSARFGKRLALLDGHQASQVFLVFHH